ncbi:hypothetical protein Tco_1254888 [Tanacetum coccineum]
MDKCDSINTPVATKPKLDADLSETPIDQTRYRSILCTLSSKTNGKSPQRDADHAECLDTRKSTSKGIQFLGGKASQLDVQEARLHCNVNSRSRARGVIFKDCQGRLLASFQDDAKYEHVGQDTRSQDGKDDKDIKEKI